MKQVHANYTFVASTKTITLTGLNIAQDQLLLITNATRGVIYYNFASSSHRAVVTAGANTAVVLTDASTTGHSNSDQLVIHYDDQLATQPVSGAVTALDDAGSIEAAAYSALDSYGVSTSANQTTTNASLGATNEAAATTDTATSGLNGLLKRLLQRLGSLIPANLTVTSTRLLVDGSGVTQPVSGTVTANVANVVTTDTYFVEQAIKVVGPNGGGIALAGYDSNGNQAIIYEDGGIPVYPRDNKGLNAPFPISGTVTANVNVLGDQSDPTASSDSETNSIIAFNKRISTHLAALRDEVGGGSNAVGGLSGTIGKRTDTAPTNASDSGSLIGFLKRLNSAFDTVFSSSYLSLNNSQATFRISHPYGTLSHASPNYIISANVPQLLFSAKNTTTPRRALQIQNVSDVPMYVGFGTSGLLANPMASGAVNAVSITNGGSGYASAPTVTFSAPTGPSGRIATATGIAVVSGGVVTSIVITDGGGGYLSAPSITFSGGSPSVAASASSIIGSIGWHVAPTFGSIGFDRGFIPNDAIYISCGTAGKAFVAFQA